MPDKPSLNLTELVEQKLLAVVDLQESHSNTKKEVLHVENYLKLADLYHFHKDFEKEHQILVRFSKSEFASPEELQDIYERIERVAKTRHVLRSSIIEKASAIDALSLIAIESEPDVVEMHSRAKVNLTHISPKREIEPEVIKYLTLCAAYTGKKENEEIIQLSLVLSEFSPGAEQKFKLLKSLTCARKVLKPLQESIFQKFNIDKDAHIKSPFKLDEVIALFKEADYIISHNHPEIERNLLVTLMPEIIDSQWYSSQKDIPWRALGYDSIGLSKLCRELGKRMPRTTMERAKAISLILQQQEPSGGNIFFERIRNMKPMKAIVMTDTMLANHKKLRGTQSKLGPVIFTLVILAAATVAGFKYWGVF